jgi:hypothetical protein
MDTVEFLYQEASELDSFLMSQGEFSLRMSADANLRKSMLLASASYLEKQICDLIIEYVRTRTTDEKIVSFVNGKAISRQYHTYFNWNEHRCNSFLALFGSEFKKAFGTRINQNTELMEAISLFLEIGRERNRMVHQDFGSYTLEKTLEEINTSHRKAKLFISELRAALLGSTVINENA